MKKKLHLLLTVLLMFILLLCGCTSSNVLTSGEVSGKEHTSEKFQAFTRQLFIDSVSTDALTLHYELKDPSAYQITLDTIDLGRIDLNNTDEADDSLKDAQKQLHSFDYDALTIDQQLTYDILDEYLQTELSINSEELFYYPECLSSTSGIHSVLPILMSEYTFYNQEDIDIYLTLLEDIPAYFDNILAYEQAKSDAGLFMSDESVDEVVSACREFINDLENNMLIEIFPEKLAVVDGLSEKETVNYTQRNKDAVLHSVIPAYESLIEGLEVLKGTGQNENGLAYYDHGKEYYEYLVKSKTGSDKTPDELIAWLEETMETDMMKLAFLLSADQSLYSRLNDTSIDLTEPDKMLDTLQNALTDNFPKALTDNYTLKYVHESLENSMNPAFYMIPPVDDPDSNVIYLNNSQLSDNLSVFTTLAHEGYPGHLYQHAAFAATDPDPIRQELSFLGYIEGWATYVENMSYEWAGFDNGMSRCLQINQEVTLCLYARIDLGVHYEGWTEDDVASFLTDYGINDAETVHEVFRAIVTDPAAYLPYCIGYLEFQDLRETTEEAMGDDFNLKDFHEFLLKSGPCQFNIIDKYLEKELIIS